METTVVNVNCIRDKFSGVSHLIYNNLDIFAIAETKPDSSFPETQFILSGMRKPFLLDVTSRKGGLLVFVDNDIPPKYLRSFHLPGDIQAIPFEINLVSIYRPPDQNLDYFLSSIAGLLHLCLKSYEDFVIMGNFNANESNPTMETFLNQYKLKI